MRLFPSVKAEHQRTLDNAEERYQQALRQHATDEVERNTQIAKLHAQHEKEQAAFLKAQDEQNEAINEFQKAYYDGDREAIIAYCSMVLERSLYPEGVVGAVKVTYSMDSKELLVEYDLPTTEIVPAVLEYKYVKARDAIEGKARKQSEVKDLYQDIIAAIALRTIHGSSRS
jgi:restriction system protein